MSGTRHLGPTRRGSRILVSKRILASAWGPVITGAFIGVLAPILAAKGNPGNMGICVACFSRDIAGALGLHRSALVQYIRPEIPGFILGAFAAAIVFGEFKPRCGSSPIIRFFLGVFATIGALIFLGCPWRAYLRLSGGDWNAICGITGLIVGILIGIAFLKSGFSLGRNRPSAWPIGIIAILIAVGLLLLLIYAPLLGRDPKGQNTGPVFFSKEGPGSMHAPLFLSLIVGFGIGFLAQRSRFCTVGAIRDFVLLRDPHLLYGILALIATAFVTNLLLGQFKHGFTNQPVSHTNELMNFSGMVLAGLAFTLAGGCPGRQVFLSGEGDGDATLFVLGMLVGAGFAHNFSLASSPTGPGAFGTWALAVGLIFCIGLGFTMRDKSKV